MSSVFFRWMCECCINHLEYTEIFLRSMYIKVLVWVQVDADSSASSTDTLEAPESTPELESGRCEPRPPRQYASWSRSILLPQEIPLKRSRTAPRRISSPNSPPCPSGSSETKRRFRWSRSVPGYKLPCRNGTVLLETLMEQFPGLQLTRETKNYVRNKLGLLFHYFF